VVHVGRVYDVQPHDIAHDVARRFGMDDEAFMTLNADMSRMGMTGQACESIAECMQRGNGTMYQWCILPSSCEGESGSIYLNREDKE